MTRDELRDALCRLHLEAADIDVDVSAILGVVVRMMISGHALAPISDAALMAEHRALERDAEAELLGRVDQVVEGLDVSE
jgi:hypothetical protein